MSPEALEQSFREIELHANTLKAVRDGRDPNDPATIKDYGLTLETTDTMVPGGATAPEGGGSDPAGRLTDAAYAAGGTGGDKAQVDDSAIGVAEFTNDQKAAYEGFWKANPDPTPEQLTTFLGSIGINNVTNAADIIQKVKEGAGYSTTRLQSDYRTKVEQRVKRQDELGIGGGSNAEVLARQGATLNLSDEASGVGNALANAVTSPFTAAEFDPVTSYGIGRDAERLRIADAREQLGYGGTAIEFAGALVNGLNAGHDDWRLRLPPLQAR